MSTGRDLHEDRLDAMGYVFNVSNGNDTGLTVAKLKEAKRRLAIHSLCEQFNRTICPPVVIRPGKIHYVSETPVTTKKQKPEKFNTIGVRFLEGPNPQKVYTYKVRIGAKVHLGQELVADTPRGPAVVVVVRIDKKPMAADTLFDTSTCGTVRLKYIEKKAVAL